MGLRVLLERHRLAGQRRLVDEEILRRDQPHVRRDHVAGRQQHDVAGHELLDRHFDMILRCARYLATHGRGDQHHPLQRFSSLVRTMFLDETQRDAQAHHDRDHDGDPLIAQEVGRGRERQQQQVQRVDRPADQLADDRMARRLRDLVGTDRAQPRLDLPGREALRGSVNPLQRFVRRQASDLTEGIPARGQAFGCGRRSVPDPGKDGHEGGPAVLLHALVSVVGT